MQNPPGPAVPVPASENAERTARTPAQQEISARDEKRGARLKDRLALITGASRGLGAAVAKRFAAEGARLVLLARDTAALEKLDDELRADGYSATLVPLDLRQFDQLDAMAASLHQRFGGIDIFVSCAAALGHLAPTGHFDPTLWQEIIDVNVTANWRLIRALDPLLRASPAGRAIFTTCIAARESEPYWAPYAASKAALEALVNSYAEEVAQATLRVNLVDPGPMRTALRFAAFPFEERDKIKPPEDATTPFVTLAEESCTANGTLLTL
ncbi:MAG TPA: SDR family NAD(P)-dependent oxidoreductase [Stellaceae bacterium]|jgi:NAD(P)-dependent dehydrogenase (short-subunit alcohol dehydrogenase family)